MTKSVVFSIFKLNFKRYTMRKKKADIIKEAVEQMKECVKNGDAEVAHVNADDILCDVLKQLGAKELVDEFNKVTKWYA